MFRKSGDSQQGLEYSATYFYSIISFDYLKIQWLADQCSRDKMK